VIRRAGETIVLVAVGAVVVLSVLVDFAIAWHSSRRRGAS